MMIAIRSIFSTCNALCQGGLLTLHDVPPSICYPSGRRWQWRGPKPGEQRNLDLRIGRESASRHDDCQHQGGRGPAVRGKVNPDEVLIKVVIRNKPKMLSGLNQKVRGPRTFWFKPDSIFGLFPVTTFISTSPGLTLPRTAGPRPPWCWQSSCRLALSRPIRRSRLRCSQASDLAIASDARWGSRSMAEHRVMSEDLLDITHYRSRRCYESQSSFRVPQGGISD